MAILVEDGTGIVGAESYISVQDADAYHLKYGNEAWAGLDEGQKEIALRKASRDIDILYGTRFPSKVLYIGQGRLWPRVPYLNPIGTTVYGKPAHLTDAVAELALLESTIDVLGGGGEANAEGNIKQTKVKIADLQFDTEYFAATTPVSNQINRITALIGPLLTYSISTPGRYATVIR